MSLPAILVVSLGGTITMTGSAGSGIAPTLSAADLLASVPPLSSLARLQALSPTMLPGASLTLAHLIEVARLLRQRLAGDCDGAVVVQGTDTIEDTAFVLDLLVGEHGPVVVTGAMRGAQAPGADGPANLLAAVRVAADTRLRGAGVVVVLNDEIHSARHVQKMHTGLPSAFASPSAGPIGFVAESRVELTMQPRRAPSALEPQNLQARDVALVSLGLGEDARLLPALAGLGYAGAVIEAMGAGHVPAAAVERIAGLAATMPVVLATRVRGGRTYSATYGFPGSEIDLIGRGVIPAGLLSANKARLLLALLLGSGKPVEAIRSAFESLGSNANA